MIDSHTINSYKSVLKKVFIIHVIMFFVSLIAAIIGGSSSVLADSLDFIGDAINYALAFYVLHRSLIFKAVVSVTKAVTMLCFGIPVVMHAFMGYAEGSVPDYEVMELAGTLGIFAHAICIFFLFQHRTGDSNRLSVWICTINDLVSNLLTLIAAFLVKITNSIIPDMISAFLIVGITTFGALIILRQAIAEIKEYRKMKLS